MKHIYTRLHLIECMDLWSEIDHCHTETGYWSFTEDQADSFIGCKLFLHKHQTSPAYRAGTIVTFRKQKGKPYPGKIVFRIQNDDTLIGTTTSGQGWSRWWKVE